MLLYSDWFVFKVQHGTWSNNGKSTFTCAASSPSDLLEQESVRVRKDFNSNRIGLDNNLAALSLFWDTVSLFENILLLEILWTQPRKV